MKKPDKRNKVAAANKKQADSAGIRFRLFLCLVLAIVFIVYLPALNKEFLNYDDKWYIYENPFFHPFSFANIGQVFTEFYRGQYSPLPTIFIGMLSMISGDNPALCNLAALLLHLVNVSLVCWLVLRLTRNQQWALAVALLFGVCTLNVESVAWLAAAFKTGFYAAFFLLSLIAYTYYLSSERVKHLAVSVLFFVLAFLSKEQAAALVLSMLCIDIFYGRKIFSKKVMLEKIPYLFLTFLFGAVTLMAARSNREELVYTDFSLPLRFLYASYAVVEYIIRIFVPLNLSAHYPYPEPGKISIWVYAHPLLLAGLLYFFFRTRKTNKAVAFGILFFISNILFSLVLQIVSVRQAMMADRYVYISSIGIFFAAAGTVQMLKLPIAKWMFAVLVIFSSVQSYARCGVWKNSLALWNDVISRNENIALAYNNRGDVYKQKNRYDLALSDFNKAVELNPDNLISILNRGSVNSLLHRDEDAIRDYSHAIELKPDLTIAWFNRGTLLSNQKKYDEAINDFTKAIGLNPSDAAVYLNRGDAFQNKGETSAAFADYGKAIELKPAFTIAYFNRATLFQHEGRNDEALADFSKAIELNPAYVEALINRGNIFRDSDRFSEALTDYNSASAANPDFPLTYFNRGTLYMKQAKNEEAVKDFSKAVTLNPDYAKAFFNRGIAYNNAGNNAAACNDLNRAAVLGYAPAQDAMREICK